jgi:hypothetical protein
LTGKRVAMWGVVVGGLDDVAQATLP